MVSFEKIICVGNIEDMESVSIMKSKILFVVNHFEYSNGVATALRNMIANLDTDKYDISVLPLYRHDQEFSEPIIDRITIIKGIGRYFRGLDKLINMLPLRLLFKIFIKEKEFYNEKICINISRTR